jgi:hypothetical protein
VRSFDVGVEPDDLFWGDLQTKGLVGGKIHDSDTGRSYSVMFFTTYTLNEWVEDQLGRSRATAIGNVVVVSDVTYAELFLAVEELDLSELVSD